MPSYISQTLIFIGAAIVLVPVFKRLGFGSVLGYLMAGIVVGPSGLALIGNAESVMHLAELGVVLLLFVIGLEIQPLKLWAMRRQLAGLGALQILFSTLVFAAAGIWSGIAVGEAVAIGFALSLSSTAYALQSLMERNQFNTQFGQASFSVLLMQDLIAIPALAFIPALLKSNSGVDTHPSAPSLMGFLGVVVFLFVASRFLIRPAFRAIASTRSREIFTASALFIVLGVTVLMQKVGLSAALGAFIAGVLLADSEYRHELEATIEPFKNLFMGLFFIAVGMGVTLSLLGQKPLQVLGLSLAYLVSKALIIYGVARAGRMPHANAKLMALNIAQGGEFAFVIFGMLATLGGASSQYLPLLTLVITLSMALNSLLHLVYERWLLPRFSSAHAPAFDQIPDENPQVILAGFGRVGQIFGRILRAQGIPFVAIDHDSEEIEVFRKFGNKVYYGDAGRRDLLESAGAARAKYFVLAIDDVDRSVEVAKTVREHFPNLKIFARARNRGHVFELMDAGVAAIRRETFDSSVFFVKDLLMDMGIAPEQAKKIVERFKRHDELMLQEQYKVHHDDKALMSVSKQGAEQLAQVLSSESNQSYFEGELKAPSAPRAEA